MPLSALKLVQHSALYAAVLALVLLDRTASAAEPYRTLPPSGDVPHPAVLLVPGCSGFAATSGVNIYEERAAELQAAGYFVVFVDYVGRRMQNNCAHISLAEVSADIIEASSVGQGISPALTQAEYQSSAGRMVVAECWPL